jgi:hypothetical protein
MMALSLAVSKSPLGSQHNVFGSNLLHLLVALPLAQIPPHVTRILWLVWTEALWRAGPLSGMLSLPPLVTLPEVAPLPLQALRVQFLEIGLRISTTRLFLKNHIIQLYICAKTLFAFNLL